MRSAADVELDVARARLESAWKRHGSPGMSAMSWFAALVGVSPSTVQGWLRETGETDWPQYADTVLQLIEGGAQVEVHDPSRDKMQDYDETLPPFFRQYAPPLRHACTELARRERTYRRRFEPAAADHVQDTIERLADMVEAMGESRPEVVASTA